MQKATDMPAGPNLRRTAGVLVFLALLAWGLTDVRHRADLDPANVGSHRTDFTVYTEAGAAFFDGRDPYVVTNPRGWHYLYPPLFAMLVAPLHVLPPAWQGVVWYLLSLGMAAGCLFECRAILRQVLDGEGDVRSAWGRIQGWVVAGAALAVAFPVLDALQRGQVGLAVLWPLLAGARLILDGRGWRPFLGGICLALSITFKVTPLLPAGIVLIRLLAAALRDSQERRAWPRFGQATGGTAAGLLLFLLLAPALAVGWTDNLRHLQTWTERVAANEDRGPDNQFNAHSVRNQSLANAVYRFGNWTAYVLADGPDDRQANHMTAQPLPMDAPAVGPTVTLLRALLLVLLLAVTVSYHPQAAALGHAAVFGLACAMTLPISPISWGHHFMMLLPGAVFLPLAFQAEGRRQAARLISGSAAALLVLHYASLEMARGFAGRLGLLGLGMAVWCLAVGISLLRQPAWVRQRARRLETPDLALRT